MVVKTYNKDVEMAKDLVIGWCYIDDFI
jgi:hypothetical protein